MFLFGEVVLGLFNVKVTMKSERSMWQINTDQLEINDIQRRLRTTVH